MRIALSASPVLFALVLAGCSNSTSPASTGAMTLDLSPSGGNCGAVGAVTIPTGATVDDSTHSKVLTSGVDPDFECVVSGSAKTGFTVSATFSQGGQSASLGVTNITSAATALAPVKGSVSVASLSSAGNTLSSTNCNFFLNSPSSEKLAEGFATLDFTCDAVVNESTANTCGLKAGVVYLANCLTAVAQ